MPRNSDKKAFDPTNTASIWANPKQLDNEKQPVFRGMLNVDGEDKKVSLWLNGFFTDDADLQADIEAVVAELLELVDEAGSNSPILRGKIEDAEDNGPKSRRSGGRSERPARGSRKTATKAPAADGEAETW